jgi:ATP-binding cassette, subfamily C, bacterial CydC
MSEKPRSTALGTALWRRLTPAIRRRMALGAGLACVTAAAGLALLGLSGWFITATALAGMSAAAGASLNVFLPSAAIRLLALGRTAGRYAERVVTHDATFAVLASWREQLFRAWASTAAVRTLQRHPARVLFRLTQDLDGLESLYLRVWLPVVVAFTTSLLTGVLLGGLSVWLGAAATLFQWASGAGVWWAVAKRSRMESMRRTVLLERLRAHTVDLVAGQVDLVMAQRCEAHCQRLARTDARLAAVEDRLHRLDCRSAWWQSVSGQIAAAALLVSLAMLAEGGSISAPMAALALFSFWAALESVAALRRSAMEAGRCQPPLRRLGAALGGAPDKPSPHVAHDAPGGAHSAVLLSGVDAAYDPGQARVLQGIHLCLAPGEHLAVVGPSGAGKSALLAAVAGEIPILQGCVRAARSSWMTQRSEVFQDTLRENLLLAHSEASEAQLVAALQASGLESDPQRQRSALDLQLGEGGLGLSGGQARRLALARLFLHPCELWLLDEPTDGLDAPTARDVLARLRQRGRDKTLLIATHLRREAEWADAVAVMHQGRLQALHRRGSSEFDAVLASLRPD